MKGLLLLSHIEVENANAVSGLTYGFPSVSNFLGFTHAISRKLQKKYESLSLTGCAVICHNHQIHYHKLNGSHDYAFSLSRKPLTKEGKPPAFNEEARMHMTISLLIECDFTEYTVTDISEFKEIENFQDWIKEKAYAQRLAGGTIVKIAQVDFYDLPDDNRDQFIKQKILFSLLPGFILVNRNDLLKSHYDEILNESPSKELIDAWLDFASLKYKPEIRGIDLTEDKDAKVNWERLPKPAVGWLVPISVGYKAISPLYQKDEVANVRDSTVPFQFVETIYSIGQWLSPHRIRDFKIFCSIFWQYRYEENWYLCENNFQHIFDEIITNN